MLQVHNSKYLKRLHYEIIRDKNVFTLNTFHKKYGIGEFIIIKRNGEYWYKEFNFQTLNCVIKKFIFSLFVIPQ